MSNLHRVVYQLTKAPGSFSNWATMTGSLSLAETQALTAVLQMPGTAQTLKSGEGLQKLLADLVPAWPGGV